MQILLAVAAAGNAGLDPEVVAWPEARDYRCNLVAGEKTPPGCCPAGSWLICYPLQVEGTSGIVI